MTRQAWTLPELQAELERWEKLLRAHGYPETTVNTYVGRSEMFLRWLAGDWLPRGPNA